MKTRIITGAILFLILAPLVVVDIFSIVFQMVMGGFAVVATFELLKMYDKEKETKLSTKLIICACSALTYIAAIQTIYTSVDSYNFTFIVAAILFDVIAMMVLSVFTEFDGKDVVKGLFSIIYGSLGISALVLLHNVNVDFLIYLFLITTMTDVFAYFGGVTLGKNKMAPTISPKKTWEGAMIGSLMGTIIATVFALYFGTQNSSIFSALFPTLDTYMLVPLVVILTLSCTIIGQIGDLVASKLKRTYEIKDFGKIFPGHGGILDRFDSAIFVGMFLFMLLILM